jgi:drug/metabolite transporter (DMT)-like permease
MSDRRLMATSEGSRPEAFGWVEWGMLVGVASIWGSSYLWIELALRGLHPGVVSTGRVALGLVAIWLVPRARAPIDRADRGRLLVLGVGWFGLPMVTFPIAQELGVASSVVGMLNGATPLMTMLFASLLLRRRPGSRQLVGVTIGFVGLVAVSWPQLAAADAASAGVALILATMACNSLLANLLVPLQQHYGALPVLRRTLSVALVFTLPFGLVGLRSSTPELLSLLAMLPLGLLSTGVAFAAWTTLIGRTGASRGSVVSYLVPVVAIVLGVLVLRETVAAIALTGTAAVLVGAWLVSGRERRTPVGATTAYPEPPVEADGSQAPC